MALIRQIVERFSRGQVLERRLPEDFGGAAIWVSPDAALRFWRQSLETADPTLFAAARELVHAGDVVWDIGANVGLFTFAAAARAGSHGMVLAVEADTWLVDLLRRSARQQPAGSSRVVVLPAAVSDQVDVAELEIAARGRASNHLAGLGGTQTGGTRERQHVVSLTLDWLAERFPRPSVLKVDVEGAEALLLRGAKRLLAEAQPKILIEVLEENASEVGQVLKAHGYMLFDADQEPWARKPLQTPAFNTLAVLASGDRDA